MAIAVTLGLALLLPGCQDPGAQTGALARITLSSASIAFSTTAGSPDPAEKTVWVSNMGEGALSGLTVALTYGSGLDWLDATLGADTAPAALTIRARTANLSSGTYAATVSLQSICAENSPQVVDVTLNVKPRLRPGQSYTTAGVTVTFSRVYYVKHVPYVSQPLNAIAIDVILENTTAQAIDYSHSMPWGTLVTSDREQLDEASYLWAENARYFRAASIPAGKHVRDTRSFQSFHGLPASFAFQGTPSFADAAEFELAFAVTDILPR